MKEKEKEGRMKERRERSGTAPGKGLGGGEGETRCMKVQIPREEKLGENKIYVDKGTELNKKRKKEKNER